MPERLAGQEVAVHRKSKPSKIERFQSADDVRHQILSDPFASASRDDLLLRQSWIARLRALRESSGLRQQDVAVRMRTSQSTISEFESAETDPQLSTLQKYCRAIGYTLELNFEPQRAFPKPFTVAHSAAVVTGEIFGRFQITSQTCGRSALASGPQLLEECTVA